MVQQTNNIHSSAAVMEEALQLEGMGESLECQQSSLHTFMSFVFEYFSLWMLLYSHAIQ